MCHSAKLAFPEAATNPEILPPRLWYILLHLEPDGVDSKSDGTSLDVRLGRGFPEMATLHDYSTLFSW